MAWSAPMTAVANTAFTAAQFNQFVRDNLLECPTAKATAEGNYFVVTGANSVAERSISQGSVFTTETSTATAYSDLTTVGPSVTVETGTTALVIVSCQQANTTVAGASARMSYAVSGATTIAAADSWAVGHIAGGTGFFSIASRVMLEGALTPGSHTFTAKYRVSSGTGSWAQRRIQVLPL